jgi:hypothetical protein
METVTVIEGNGYGASKQWLWCEVIGRMPLLALLKR